MPSKFRVIIQNASTATRGPSTVAAIIDDAKDIGASEQVNGEGEFFMTLPINHPSISAVVPLQTHYNVQRWSGSAYTTIFRGLVDDYEATRDEVVFYGRDWLSLLAGTVTQSGTTYTNQYIGAIVSAELSIARTAPNSRVNFITAGTIENTATTTVALTSYQSRLEFISQLADIAMADSTTRTIIQVSPRSSDTPAFTFTANQGADREGVRLEYGGMVNDFFYAPGYSTLATMALAIGQKRDGATVLYGSATTVLAPMTTYGRIQVPMLFTDIVNQSALDKKTQQAARRQARIGKTVGLGIQSGRLAPWDGYDLGDSVRVIINRGIVNLNALYTVWGVEWIGHRSGKEDLTLSLLPKDA